MRNVIFPIVTALALGAATPAVAIDSGDQISMETALDVATGLGVVTVSYTQFLGDEWEMAVTARAAGWRSMSTREPARCATSIADGSRALHPEPRRAARQAAEAVVSTMVHA
ncbi:hypothetical protein [Bradyrhizobium australiense]|uniref:hypothetical protein n=1 Tax=Bradyrhizobium australiense TaxID=2721161 RepID=UPI00289E2655|nr:hypothetical protein [Bradyrhizobium australiense]